jgi:hypothetical protein
MLLRMALLLALLSLTGCHIPICGFPGTETRKESPCERP